MIRSAAGFLMLCLVAATCAAQQPALLPGPDATVEDARGTGGFQLSKPAIEPQLQVLPIDLATALSLSSSRPIDVQLAAERVRTAVSVLDQAQALWLPTVTIGGDYFRHDGEIQDTSGAIINNSHSTMMFGLGSGIGTSAVLSLNDAYFAPLAARSSLSARRADVQTATNDSMVAVTDAYFSVEQARGDLAAAADAVRRTAEILRRVQSLAQGLVPPLEIVRTEAELARRQETELVARENWQVAGTELARLLRLDASAQIEPVEPPHVMITLVDPAEPIDELIATGLRSRPELAANQAQVEATLTLLRQEKLRPFIPSILLRGASTPVTGTLAGGVFAGGSNDDIGSPGGRFDVDVQVLWQLDNLGFGNRARTRTRESEHRAAVLELFRAQDRVAADVSRAYAVSRQAARRAKISERQVKLALDSYQRNLVGLGETRQTGDLIQTIVRPQEAIAAVQSLAQAYADYYRAVADSNRAQFRLYRALGQPAQLLEQRLGGGNQAVGPSGEGEGEGEGHPAAPPPAPAPAAAPAPTSGETEMRGSFQIHDR